MMIWLNKNEFEYPLFLAPMEDVTDQPFRSICKRLGADVVYTEFTSCEALIRDIGRAWQRVKILDEQVVPRDPILEDIGLEVEGGTFPANVRHGLQELPVPVLLPFLADDVKGSCR